jgi:hypothetical protein
MRTVRRTVIGGVIRWVVCFVAVYLVVSGLAWIAINELANYPKISPGGVDTSLEETAAHTTTTIGTIIKYVIQSSIGVDSSWKPAHQAYRFAYYNKPEILYYHEPTEIKLILAPATLSLNDLTLAFDTLEGKQETKKISVGHYIYAKLSAAASELAIDPVDGSPLQVVEDNNTPYWMSYHEFRPLRLMIAFEADALMANFGREAYAVACWRAEEASSEMMETDWREVALTIARKDQKRVRPSPATNWVFLRRSDRADAPIQPGTAASLLTPRLSSAWHARRRPGLTRALDRAADSAR